MRTFRKGRLNFSVINAPETSFGATSVIVTGESDAVLIDAQLTIEDAETVVRSIQESGKRLTIVYVSHGDPDFYSGLPVIRDHFRHAKFYAAPPTIVRILKTSTAKMIFWRDRLGEAIDPRLYVPEVLTVDWFELEGYRFEIIGLTDFPERTFVWIPSAKTVVGGINVFGDDFHLCTADATTGEARSEWAKALRKLAELKPEAVVPAHGSMKTSHDISSVEQTKNYLKYYEEALQNVRDSDSLIGLMRRRFPGLGFEDALVTGAKANIDEIC